MSFPDLLPIAPFTRHVHGEVILPGSKSLTNRALLLAALCDQSVELTGALASEDTELMAEALRKLGLTVDADETAKTVRVSGQKNLFSTSERVELFVGLAGTAARSTATAIQSTSRCAATTVVPGKKAAIAASATARAALAKSVFTTAAPTPFVAARIGSAARVLNSAYQSTVALVPVGQPASTTCASRK